MSNFVDYSGKKGRTKYGFSGETTQFEDALIKHNVITREQALLNKGMDEEDVARLLVNEAVDAVEVDYHVKDAKKTEREEEEDEELDDELDDMMAGFEVSDRTATGEFSMEEYREKRKQQIIKDRERAKREKEEYARVYRFGDVNSINREDWEREVNQGSASGQWVVVVLTSTSVEEALLVERSIEAVAAKFKNIKFLKIRSTSAIERWPDSNLPTVFCYRDGEMQKQMIGVEQCGGPGTNAERLEWRLKRLGVLGDSTMTKDAERSKGGIAEVNKLRIKEGEGRRGMSLMSTYGTEDDEDTYT